MGGPLLQIKQVRMGRNKDKDKNEMRATGKFHSEEKEIKREEWTEERKKGSQ